MKAVVLEQFHKLSLEDIEPEPLDYGQVLVRVYCSTICGAQLGEITGAKGPDNHLPHLLGHEGAGIVESLGGGVTHVSVGDHVVMHWRKGVGIEAKPPKYRRKDGRIIGGGPVTTFNEMAVVSENRLTPISPDVPFDIAALMGCAVTTGLGVINNEAKLRIGQTIAVAGCGGVGLNVIQGAALCGASSIIAIDLRSGKLAMAKVFGATDLIDVSSWSTGTSKVGVLIREVMLIALGGVDVFVDCTGDVTTIADGLVVTAPGGRLILVGQPPCDAKLTIPTFRQHYCGKTIMDSQGGLTNPTVDIPRYLELYRKEKLLLDKQITHKFPLVDINKAISTAATGAVGRVALEMG